MRHSSSIIGPEQFLLLSFTTWWALIVVSWEHLAMNVGVFLNSSFMELWQLWMMCSQRHNKRFGFRPVKGLETSVCSEPLVVALPLSHVPPRPFKGVPSFATSSSPLCLSVCLFLVQFLLVTEFGGGYVKPVPERKSSSLIAHAAPLSDRLLLSSLCPIKPLPPPSSPPSISFPLPHVSVHRD